MKQVFLHLLFYLITPYTFSQNSINPKGITAPQSESERWNLGKYVWSHTHTKYSKGDKPILDFGAIDNWIGVGPDEDLCISPDGKYFVYGIIRHNAYQRRDTLVVQSTDNSWRRAFAGQSNKAGFFSANSKQYIFFANDTLCFLELGAGGQLRYVKGVSSHKEPDDKKNEWLAYQLKDSKSTLILQNLLTGKEQTFDDVAEYSFDGSSQWLVFKPKNDTKGLIIHHLSDGKEKHFTNVSAYLFSANGKGLVLKSSEQGDNANNTVLQYINLETEIGDAKMKAVWSVEDKNSVLGAFTLDHSGRKVAFIVQDKSTSPNSNSIWYWREGMDKAVLKVWDKSEGIDAGLLIQAPIIFTENDNYISFNLQQRPDNRQPMEDAVQLDIWSYRDTILQATQSHLSNQPKTYRALVGIDVGPVIRENSNEWLDRGKGDFGIIKKLGKEVNGDRFWENGYDKDSCWLVSFKDGFRKFIAVGQSRNDFIWHSPGGNYLVYFDAAQGCNYFSYNLNTGKLTNISAGIPAWRLGATDAYTRPQERPTSTAGITGWLEKDKSLLVYDDYDIWQLDLSGKTKPVNVTNGYGRSHHIIFRLAGSHPGNFENFTNLSEKGSLLLKAFNEQNKYAGFYRVNRLGVAADPTQLYMGPCVMEQLSRQEGMKPLKAANADVWIVKRQSPTESPNYFLTTDFKTYKPLTNLQPQKSYNWLTAELLSFKQMDGTMSQGILYKPENFDSSQKYPVIVPFYTQSSDMLYIYPKPEYMNVPIAPMESPAWLLSHGYLVFVPDVYFTKGQWGPSTVNTMDGAARFLSSLPYVDGKHIGACGHSKSGRFGYYLLTHSHSFAAMSLSSGLTGTNIIGLALSLDYATGTKSNLQTAEAELGNLWDNKEKWIDHTAVLQVDNATSPLLLLHNKLDGDDIVAAVQLSIAMRRLGKPVWWLQYDQGSHTLTRLTDKKDFTIRYTQFFDHYLKGAPEPKWMIEGIPYKLKGVESRYELNSQ